MAPSYCQQCGEAKEPGEMFHRCGRNKEFKYPGDALVADDVLPWRAVVAAVDEYLSRLTYKPGSKFKCIVPHDISAGPEPLHLIFEVRIVVPDVYHPEELIPVIHQQMVTMQQLQYLRDYDELDDYVLRVVTDMIRRLELHEVDEWFKVDGHHVRNPHPENLQINLAPLKGTPA